jgi:hypothetical protein
MRHELRCWPEHFEAVLSCGKRFEVRLDEAGFARGDSVLLREWIPSILRGDEDLPIQGESIYTGRELEATVTYVLRDVELPGLAPGYCAFGIELVR